MITLGLPDGRLLFVAENIFAINPDERIIGSFLYDKHKEVVAKIEGLVLERETYLSRFLVFTQGGFLNIQGKKILLPREAYVIADLGEVKTSWSKQGLQDAPIPHDPHNVSQSEEAVILSYFDIQPNSSTNQKSEDFHHLPS